MTETKNRPSAIATSSGLANLRALDRPRRWMTTLWSVMCVAILLATGCAALDSRAIRFERHDLAFAWYEARNLQIRYGEKSIFDFRRAGEAATRLARPKEPADSIRLGGILDFKAFEGPLQISWITKDGRKAEARIALETVFKEKILLHNEDHTQIDLSGQHLLGPPQIHIEVDNDTVRIYMLTNISLRDPSSHNGKRMSSNRVLAFEQRY